MGTTINPDLAQVAREVNLAIDQVQVTVELLDDGNSVPFITRYRKDRTGGLDEEQIRSIRQVLEKARALNERKQKILKSLQSQQKLTDELAALIDAADSLRRLEDIYQPFRPKKQTWASLARSRGLEPLAQEILAAEPAAADRRQRAAEFVDESQGLLATDDVLQGAGHLIAEAYSENLRLRDELRRMVKESGKLVTTRIEESATSQDEMDAEVSSSSPADEEPPAEPPPSAESAPEGPAVQEPPAEATAATEPAAEEPPAEEPPAEGTAAEGTAAEEPAAEEPAAEEPAAEGTASEERPAGEPPAEKPIAEKPIAGEPVAEGPGGEEPVPEGAAREQQSEEDPAAEEATARESSAEAPATSVSPPKGEASSGGEAPETEALLQDWSSTDAFPADATFFHATGREDAAAVEGEDGSESAAKPAPVSGRLTIKQLASKTRKESKKRKRQKKIESFKDYFDYREGVSKLPPHRLLAINRGERSKILRVRIELDNQAVISRAERCVIPPDHPHADFLRASLRDALNRLILPSLEREVRRELTDAAEAHAVQVFARNLRKLLLQPPVQNRRVLAIDPGFRSGCKLAALDEYGNVLGHTVIHVIGKEDVVRRGRQQVVEMIRMYHIPIIALGNGTGCREAEKLLADILAHELRDQDIRYAIVNEAGASVYSTSAVGRDELPRFDPVLRSAVSIGRRLQDPLSELVKIDPASIGVGLYQHDVKGKHLKESLDAVVESCVNYVGVDVNTASPALLGYVSGLNQLTARRVYEYRQRHGPFRDRNALKKVAGFGDVTFEQAAGFLKIIGGKNPLDATWIHPESYEIAERAIEKLGGDLRELAARMRAVARKALPPATAMQQFARGVLADPRDSGPAASGGDVIEEPPTGDGAPAPAPEEKTAGVQEPGAAVHEPAPAAHESAPAVHEPASAPHEPAPAAHEPAPATHEPAPAAHEPAPAAHEPAPAAHEPAPAAHDPAPVAHEPAPAAHEAAPAVHEAAPAAHEPAPATHEAAVHEPAPAAHEPAPAAHEPAPAAHEPAPAAHEPAPGAELETPATPEQAVAVAQGGEEESLSQRAAEAKPKELAAELGIGELLVRDILQALRRPGRDPREDLPQPLFRREVMKLEDLQPGMLLNGTVLNVVDFGAFVDMGLHDSGLVHISRLADRYVRDPHEVVSVGDILNVWVIEVDKQRRRVSLSAIPPGTEKAAPPRPERGGGRGRREGKRPGRGDRGEGKRADERRTGRGKPGRSAHTKPPQPVKPITPEMVDGKEPMRSFSDLLQFFEKKEEPDKRKKKGKKKS